jgi:hypothetical protein
MSSVFDVLSRMFSGMRPGELPRCQPDVSHLPAADNRMDEETSEPVKAVRPPSQLVDRRAHASKKHDYGQRDWSKVTGICLHQTACVLGERAGRWDTVGCHIGVTRGGQAIWLHDFDRLIVHGNGWNTQTVGIEIDGMYEGVEGDDSTFWRPKEEPNRQPQRLTSEAAETARQVVRWICETVAANGGKVRALVAHRQASENRRSDPGSQIWQEVALPLHTELGLSDGGRGFKLGTGYPIPESWDPAKRGIKY